MTPLRPKCSPHEKATHGMYRRQKSPTDEGKGQPKRGLCPDQDRSQLLRNAARDENHRLKASTDRRSGRQVDYRFNPRMTSTKRDDQTAPIR